MAASMDPIYKPIPSGEAFDKSIRAEAEAKWGEIGYGNKTLNKEIFINKLTQEIVKQKFAELLQPFEELRGRNIQAAALVDDKQQALKTNMSNLKAIFSKHFDDLKEFQPAMIIISNSLGTLNVEETQNYAASVRNQILSSQSPEALKGILTDFYHKFRLDLDEAKKLQDPTMKLEVLIAMVEANYRILDDVMNKLNLNSNWELKGFKINGLRARGQFNIILPVLERISKDFPDKQRVVDEKMRKLESEINEFYKIFY